MIIDEATVTLSAGKGGPGKVSFLPGKKSGPDGGDGGKGADLYVQASSQVTSLAYYASNQRHAAPNGEPGGQNRKTGARGEDLVLTFPVGTQFTDLETKEQFELERDGQQILVCKGGKGGRGNDYFKSPSNTTPRRAQPGLKGQQRSFRVIMRLIADVGLIGLPNAGKSTLLNTITNANVATADYPFTTLAPNLGAINGTILADIPGLIEGASTGKGLGTRFLKHIEKVSTLLHCISVESDDVLRDYQVIRTELKQFHPALTEKPELILLTKCDVIDDNEIMQKEQALSQIGRPIHCVSVLDDASVARVIGLIS